MINPPGGVFPTLEELVALHGDVADVLQVAILKLDELRTRLGVAPEERTLIQEAIEQIEKAGAVVRAFVTKGRALYELGHDGGGDEQQ